MVERGGYHVDGKRLPRPGSGPVAQFLEVMLLLSRMSTYELGFFV